MALSVDSQAATWLGNTSANWNVAANWGGMLPTLAGDTFVFGAAGTAGTVLNNDIVGQVISSLTFNSGAAAWTLGGNAMTLGGGVTNSSTALQTINFNIATTAVRTFTMTAGGGNIAVGGVISGTGGGLSLATAGSLTLSGANTYTGNTTIGSGTTLNIANATAIGIGTLVAGGTAILDNTSAGAITLTNNNNLNLSGGSLTFTGTQDLSFGSGIVTISGASRTITTTAGTLTLGSIDASGTTPTIRVLTKDGNGTLIVSNAAGSNFQGGTTLTGGALAVSNNTALGTGAIAFGSGTTFQAIVNDVTLANTGTINNFAISGSQNLTFTSKLTGITGGSRTLTNNIGAGKTLTLGALDIMNDTSATSRTLTIAGTGNTTITGTIAPGDVTATTNRGLTITNTGLTILSSANTYVGTTTISGGLVRLDNANSLPGGVGATGGTSGLLFNGGVIGLTTATGDFTRGLGTTNPAADLVGWGSSATGGFAAFGGDRIVNFGGAAAAVTWSTTTGALGGGLVLGHSTSDSTITVVNPIGFNGAARTITVNDGTKTVDAIMSGVLSGNTSSLTKTGAGTLALTGTNTYGLSTTTGTTFTTISAGTLQIGNGSTSGSLTGAGTGDIQNDATLAFNRSNALAMPYVIKGTGTVKQIGAGKTTLSAINTYTGPTTMTNGTLEVTGSINSTSTVSVTDGTLLLGGSNVINNSASVTLGNAILSTAGNSESAGTAAGLGALLLTSTSTIDFGSGASILWFSGVTGITGVLNITNWSGDPVAGGGTDQLRFTGDPSAFLSQISFGGSGAKEIFFSNGGNSYYEVVAIPEPSATALIGAALLCSLVGYRERRRLCDIVRGRDA